MLRNLTCRDSIDQHAILVSNEGILKLLGVPKIPSSTEEAQAAAVFNLTQEWNLTDCVRLMSFDTTACNTGLNGGACVLLEQKLKRRLVSLACRHDILELIVAKVFSTLIETATSKPEIKLFQRFAEYWSSIDRQSYESGIGDVRIALQFESDNQGRFDSIH